MGNELPLLCSRVGLHLAGPRAVFLFFGPRFESKKNRIDATLSHR